MSKPRNYKHLIRRTHRYLGVFIGIQFMLWTVGGLYFSWTNIDEIRGENRRHEHEPTFSVRGFAKPDEAIAQASANGAHVVKFQLIDIGGEPHYEVVAELPAGKKETIAFNAVTGVRRPQISESEANRIATESLKDPREIKSVVFLTDENVGRHHEYREKPLPAWAVTFSDGVTVYISATTGQIGATRGDKWRVFDFLWMLHTMDFIGRDDINNYLLRAFSILGILTVTSGFLLFFVSSKAVRRLLIKSRTS
jgi:uncharacterized iron-regulated membrane protein